MVFMTGIAQVDQFSFAVGFIFQEIRMNPEVLTWM